MGPLAIALVAFLGVGREGLETAIFFYATTEAAGQGNNQPLIGWVIGLGAVVLGWLIYRGAVKINLATFFRYTGILLVLVAAGILAYGIHDLQEAGFLPGLTTLAFDVSATVDPGSWYATLLKGIFNFTPATTVLQAIAWVLYVGIVLTLFLRPAAGRPGRPGAAGPQRDPDERRASHRRRLTVSRRPARPVRFALTPTPSRRTTMPRPALRPAARAVRTAVPVALSLAAALALTGCADKPTATAGSTAAGGGGGPMTVNATDTACELSATTAKAGTVTFQVTNSGSKVNEFYLYAEGDRIVSEVENITPGLSRELKVEITEPGTFTTSCKPGMVGDGIRGAFTVTGTAAKGSADSKVAKAITDYKAFVASEADEFVDGTKEFVAAVKAGDVAKAKSLYAQARHPWEAIEPELLEQLRRSLPEDRRP